MNKKVLIIEVFALSSFIFAQSNSYIVPKPTGHYAVGTQTVHIADEKREEWHTKDGKNKRELLVQLWYPAKKETTEIAPYMPSKLATYVKQDLIKNLKLADVDHLEHMSSHAMQDAPIAKDDVPFPLIVFSPGRGTPIALYSALLSELASHGYIVAGINYPYVTNPVIFEDGRVIKPDDADVQDRQREIKTWVNDIRFVINQFRQLNNNKKSVLFNAINLNCIGLLGHSLGGGISVEVGKHSDQCRAIIDLDGKLYTDIQQYHNPLLFLFGEHTSDELKQFKDVVALNSDVVQIKTIDGANHGSFGDFYFITDWPNMPKSDKYIVMQKIQKSMVEFLNKHLKHKGTKKSFFGDLWQWIMSLFVPVFNYFLC